ncbi:mitochondrial [4Fe-4S] cluster transfer protein Nfu1 [Schizosaccharomyces osmophilus]|uniref:Mitochondrial [4Fe-4S] cluster transfer protein Nfu1 n=1 Tax=Schizosaccharomyces osmophilus TaxID=2545709 RepID=A0AAE9W996_9SCHI|nr:mitochondrial [4Fe-4S] cluster transfer protein Nfu1 [Schizosaccharomyces osmophilus]WBW71680.1 mitochondrial [4Fe-4S] cluster transfer protein Nfu1 [Schizosaccharomyces osmophilus]
MFALKNLRLSLSRNSFQAGTFNPRLLRRNAFPLAFQMPSSRSIWIRSEETPNENAIKFLPGLDILPPTIGTLEYMRSQEFNNSPLAEKLFGIPGVKSIFYGRDFITVSKDESQSWSRLKPEVFSTIMEHLSNGETVLSGDPLNGPSDTQILESDSQIVAMIKELLETSIRPSIQEDGGDVEFRGFDEETGMVSLKLRGACRSCSSSAVTLKSGIQQMLNHYIPEVREVNQVLDPEEEIAISEFEKFENRIHQNQQKEEK